jgi:hypothetical protein
MAEGYLQKKFSEWKWNDNIGISSKKSIKQQ